MSTVRMLAGLVVLILTGCGDGDGAPSAGAGSGAQAGPAQVRADVERVWNDVLDASRAGDGERVCSHATAKYARRLVVAAGGRSCAAAARTVGRTVSEAVPGRATPRYSSFSTQGDRATIHVTLPTDGGQLRNTVRFRLVDREWKVDGDSGLDAA